MASRYSLRKPQKFVYVDVGPNKQIFGIHKNLLCDNSAYFKAAFAHNSEEAKSGRVALKNEDPEIFGFVMEWIHTRCIEEELGERPFRFRVPGILQYVDIWVLADFLEMPDLQNYVMEAIWHTPIEENDLEQLIQKPILSETPLATPLGRYLVDHFAQKTKFQVEIYRDLPFSKVLLTEITIALVRSHEENPRTEENLFNRASYFVPYKIQEGIQFPAEKLEGLKDSNDG